MKTYEIHQTITTYSFDELNEKAKEKAYSEWYLEYQIFDDELLDTLSKFCDIFGIRLISYDVDEYNYNYKFSLDGWDSNAKELSEIRFAKYIANNFGEYVEKPKTYWSKNLESRKTRKSRIQTNRDCPLTGVCFDLDILNPVFDCIDFKRTFCDVYELFNACLNSFFKAWQHEIEYQLSEEHFEKLCNLNEYEFLEDGTFYC